MIFYTFNQKQRYKIGFIATFLLCLFVLWLKNIINHLNCGRLPRPRVGGSFQKIRKSSISRRKGETRRNPKIRQSLAEKARHGAINNLSPKRRDTAQSDNQQSSIRKSSISRRKGETRPNPHPKNSVFPLPLPPQNKLILPQIVDPCEKVPCSLPLLPFCPFSPRHSP